MTKIRTAITGVAGYVPEYILTNEELSRMVDTTDEWIMSRVGIKERHILKGEGKGASDMGAEAVKQLLEKTRTAPEEIDMVVCATVTPDYIFPAMANIISEKVGIKNAFSFDINAACCGFVYALTVASQFIETGKCKKVILVGAEKMSAITDYTDRTTCPLFGDAAAAILLQPTTEDIGIVDTMLHADGVGKTHLHMKSGGSVSPPSHKTIDAREHSVYQEGQIVYKWAVSKMADVSVAMMEKHNLTHEDIAWLVPHQANLRIIEAVGNRMGLSAEKVMVNIERYGNTTSATIPLCLRDWENQLRKGDKIMLAAFGGGFTWGSIYIKWAYDAENPFSEKA